MVLAKQPERLIRWRYAVTDEIIEFALAASPYARLSIVRLALRRQRDALI